LLPVASLPEGGVRACSADGLELVLCNVDGNVYALENRCSHAQARLSSGRLLGFELACPRHRGSFDVRNGRAVAAPAKKDIATFSVINEGGKINVIH
jgi:nitrite reductase/ring-hydroxylating ferredoxin subunit